YDNANEGNNDIRVEKIPGSVEFYKVPYPTLYASERDNKDVKLFNCIQKGHQNS
ncbi:hypothetical protein IFM89_027430, partial [Coptis chinensis]